MPAQAGIQFFVHRESRPIIPLNTVFQRYDGRCPSPGSRVRLNDDIERVGFSPACKSPSAIVN